MSDFSLEARLNRQGFQNIAGVDEAGRGPLAGPVVTAAVILPLDWPTTIRLDDSKRLTPGQREIAFEAIKKKARAWRVKVVSPQVIDRMNILQATLMGMAEAVKDLNPQPDYVLVDGNQTPRLVSAEGSKALEAIKIETVVKGDSISNSIAAASILAKVVRDRLMRVYDQRYPGWGFAQHKGYPTKAHREALGRLGPSPIHRTSFKVKPI